MKKILLILATLCCGNLLYAQDIITLKSGEEVKAVVQEIGADYVKYKKFENKNGPTYSLPKSAVFMIKYENGAKDVFTAETAKTAETHTCGIILAKSDLPNTYLWNAATKACPQGWRLPTFEELECMCKNRNAFEWEGYLYWSSTPYEDGGYYSVKFNSDGSCSTKRYWKINNLCVRCVKNAE